MNNRSAVREQDLWRWLNRGAKAHRFSCHAVRLENAAKSGDPDVYVCLDGITFWIELKCEALPLDPETPIIPRFEFGQPKWMKRHAEAGGSSFVLLQLGKQNSARRFGISAHHIDELETGMTVDQLTQVSVNGGQNLEASQMLLQMRAEAYETVVFRADI